MIEEVAMLDRAMLPRHRLGRPCCQLIHACEESLLVFARCPEPGKCKTRLIPAIGEMGATELHRRLVACTLDTAALSSRERCRNVRLLYCGEAVEHLIALTAAYCPEATMKPQWAGDLGQRLAAGVEQEFLTGRKSVIAIGTDCPGLTPRILNQSFAELSRHDVVLGPAVDGGYYLIGLSRFVPELFQGIPWGTDRVLQATTAIADSLGLSIGWLPELRDVDQKEDLTLEVTCRLLDYV